MKEMDFSHSSQNYWDLLRKLGAAEKKMPSQQTQLRVIFSKPKTLNLQNTGIL